MSPILRAEQGLLSFGHNWPPSILSRASFVSRLMEASLINVGIDPYRLVKSRRKFTSPQANWVCVYC